MKSVCLVVIVVVASACGGSYGAAPHPFDAATIVRATADPAAIEAMLSHSVTNGGLWFDDPACVAQFGTPGEIKPKRFAAFARCIAQLHLQASPRGDELSDVLVLTYAPGFEIEARVLDDDSGPRITWIGYESRTREDPLIPTISAAALEAHRLAGDPTGPLDPDVAKTLEPSGGVASTWLKICVDPTGAVTIQARDTNNPTAARAFSEAATGWKFRPFVVRDRAIPVCAMVHLTSPPQPATVAEVLPVPIGPSRLANPPNTISPVTLERRRIAGRAMIVPDDATKDEIMRSGRSSVTGAFKFCLDETGHVESIKQIRSTGYPVYDRKIIGGLRTWAYRPLFTDGKATPVCTSVTFIYSQH